MEFPNIDCKYAKIVGFEDYYITEKGDVYSTRMRGKEKAPRVRKLKPKNPGRDDKYLSIVLCSDDGQKTKSIHRLVAEYFVDGYFDGAVVNHKDGNNRNNCSDNLEWVSQRENIIKSYETSGLDQTRNYMWWSLIDRDGSVIGTFKGHNELKKYLEGSDIDVSPSSLIKYGKCNGYTIEKRNK